MLERRRFSRITFSGDCSLSDNVSGTIKTSQTTLIDISLAGALVCRPDNWHDEPDAVVSLNLTLAGSSVSLEIESKVCHQEDNLLGIKFLTLSLDSISHLKRLIQLNLADEDLLHREMSQLINLSDD